MPETVIFTAGLDTSKAERDAASMFQRISSQEIKARINSSSFTEPLGRITGSANQFTRSLEAANARVIAFGISAGILFKLQEGFRQLVRNTIEVEKALQGMNVILGLNTKELGAFSEQLFSVAKQTGNTFQEVAKAATELSRQGLGANETLKRTRDALILTRQSGLDAVDSVEAITAALNGFDKSALDSTQIINKLANVDAAFSVSSRDLAEALKRSSSVAQDAGLSIDQLVGIVTAAQQTTQRGGTVIGNALKTIFARLDNTDTIKRLQDLGVAINQSQNGIEKLRALSDAIEKLNVTNPGQADFIKRLTGGVYQINIITAALADLNKEYSVYTRATETSANATDQAIKRNEELNKTLAAYANVTLNNVINKSSTLGKLSFEPLIRTGLDIVNQISKIVPDKDSESLGSKIGVGIFDGIGKFINGPGAIAISVILAGLSINVSKFIKDALTSLKSTAFLAIGESGAEQLAIEKEITGLIARNPGLQKDIIQGNLTREQQEKEILTILQSEFEVLNKIRLVSASLAPGLFTSGVRAEIQEGRTILKTGKALSAGFIPSMQEKMGAYEGGYVPGEVRETYIKGLGKVIYNDSEKIKDFGLDQPAIIPPEYSQAGRNYKKKFNEKLGFDPYKASKGLIPNFAKSDFSSMFQNINPFYQGAEEEEIAKILDSTLGALNSKNLLGQKVPFGFTSYLSLRRKGYGSIGSENTRGIFSKDDGILLNKSILEGGLTQNIAGLGSHTLAHESAHLFDNLNQLSSSDEFIDAALKDKTRLGGFPNSLKKISTSGNAFSESFAEIFADIATGKSSFLNKLAGQHVPLANLDITKFFNNTGILDKLKGLNLNKGLVPNYNKFTGYTSPLFQAISREKDSGIPYNQIKIGQHERLRNADNPLGLGVFNLRDEPSGLIQGIVRADNEGKQPQNYGATTKAGGLVPNFADNLGGAAFENFLLPEFNKLKQALIEGSTTYGNASAELNSLIKTFNVTDNSAKFLQDNLLKLANIVSGTAKTAFQTASERRPNFIIPPNFPPQKETFLLNTPQIKGLLTEGRRTFNLPESEPPKQLEFPRTPKLIGVGAGSLPLLPDFQQSQAKIDAILSVQKKSLERFDIGQSQPQSPSEFFNKFFIERKAKEVGTQFSVQGIEHPNEALQNLNKLRKENELKTAGEQQIKQNKFDEGAFESLFGVSQNTLKNNKLAQESGLLPLPPEVIAQQQKKIIDEVSKLGSDASKIFTGGGARDKLKQISQGIGEQAAQAQSALAQAQSIRQGRLNNFGLTASIALPIVTSVAQQVIGTETRGARATGETISAVGEGASFAALGSIFTKGPAGLVIGSIFGALSAIPKIYTAFTSNLPELQKEFEKSSVKLRDLNDGFQLFVSSIEKYQNALTDTSGRITPQDIIKRQTDVTESLLKIPEQFRTAFASAAGDAQKIKEVFNDIQRNLQKDTKAKETVVSLTAEIQKSRTLGRGQIFGENKEGQLKLEQFSKQIFSPEFLDIKKLTGPGGADILSSIKKAAFSGNTQNLIGSLQNAGLPKELSSLIEKIGSNSTDAERFSLAIVGLADDFQRTTDKTAFFSDSLKKNREAYVDLLKSSDEFNRSITSLSLTLGGLVERASLKTLGRNELLLGQNNAARQIQTARAEETFTLAKPFLNDLTINSLDSTLKLNKVTSDKLGGIESELVKSQKSLNDILGKELKTSVDKIAQIKLSQEPNGSLSQENLVKLDIENRRVDRLSTAFGEILNNIKENPNQAVPENLISTVKELSKGIFTSEETTKILSDIENVSTETSLNIAKILQNAQTQTDILKITKDIQDKIVIQQQRLNFGGGAQSFLGGNQLQDRISTLAKTTLGSLSLAPGELRTREVGRSAFQLGDLLKNTFQFAKLPPELAALSIKGNELQLNNNLDLAEKVASALFGANPELKQAFTTARDQVKETATLQVSNQLKLENLPQSVIEIKQAIEAQTKLMERQESTYVSDNTSAFAQALKDTHLDNVDNSLGEIREAINHSAELSVRFQQEQQKFTISKKIATTENTQAQTETEIGRQGVNYIDSFIESLKSLQKLPHLSNFTSPPKIKGDIDTLSDIKDLFNIYGDFKPLEGTSKLKSFIKEISNDTNNLNLLKQYIPNFGPLEDAISNYSTLTKVNKSEIEKLNKEYVTLNKNQSETRNILFGINTKSKTAPSSLSLSPETFGPSIKNAISQLQSPIGSTRLNQSLSLYNLNSAPAPSINNIRDKITSLQTTPFGARIVPSVPLPPVPKTATSDEQKAINDLKYARTLADALKIVDGQSIEINDHIGDIIKQLNEIKVDNLKIDFANTDIELRRIVKDSTVFTDEIKQVSAALDTTKIRLGKFNIKDVLGDFRAEFEFSTNDFWRQLRSSSIETADTIKTGFGDAFKSIADGSKKAGDAFRDFGLTIAKTITDKTIDLATNQLFSLLLGQGNGGSLATAIGGLFSKKSEGGLIGSYSTGGKVIGGTGMKDDVPALLTKGEFVIRKQAVQKYGTDLLSSLNNTNVRRFATGGSTNQQSANIQLTNQFDYTGPLIPNDLYGPIVTHPTGGNINVSPLFSAFGAQNEDNPQNKLRMAREDSLYKYLLEKRAYDLQKQRALEDYNRKKRQALLSAYITAAINVGAGAIKAYQGRDSALVAAGKVAPDYNPGQSTNFGGYSDFGYSGNIQSYNSSSYGHALGGVINYSRGGYTGTDNVPALLTGGEFIINKKSVDRIGINRLNQINQGLVSVPAKRYETGGLVGRDVASVSNIGTSERSTAINDSLSKLIEINQNIQSILSSNNSNRGNNGPINQNPAISPITNNVSININLDKNNNVTSSNTSSQQQGAGNDNNKNTADPTSYKKFAEAIKIEVLKTIISQQRSGGILNRAT